MKIKFKVPEWVIGKHIWIFANQELIGHKEVKVTKKDGKHITSYLPIKIKTGRCTGCGSCCEDGSPFPRPMMVKIKKALQGYKDYDGQCPFLEENGCLLGTKIPFSCARSVCTQNEGCTEK